MKSAWLGQGRSFSFFEAQMDLEDSPLTLYSLQFLCSRMIFVWAFCLGTRVLRQRQCCTYIFNNISIHHLAVVEVPAQRIFSTEMVLQNYYGFCA